MLVVIGVDDYSGSGGGTGGGVRWWELRAGRRGVSHLTLAAGFPVTRVKPANTLLAKMTLPDLVVMVVLV